MYFPRGFDHRRAVQLGQLVCQAYEQLNAFATGRPWKVPDGYTLVAELRQAAPSAPSPRGLRTAFDAELQKLVRSRAQREAGLPLGFIARRKADTFVVFRGTMTASEWIRDLKIRLTRYPYGEGAVHEGFNSSYGLLRSTVVDSLGSVRGGRLYVAGHSLGAALATLAVGDIIRNTGCRAPTCYTFASPRVGDRAFAAEYNRLMPGRSFRIANTSDVIVSMPFPVPFLAFLGGYFTHVDTPVDFTMQEESMEKNHDMSAYMAALDEGRPRGPFGGAPRQVPRG